MNVTTQISVNVMAYGLKYIVQTKNTIGGHHFFYCNTGATDQETVCVWKIYPKTGKPIKP